MVAPIVIGVVVVLVVYFGIKASKKSKPTTTPRVKNVGQKGK